MFDRIKKALFGGANEAEEATAPNSQMAQGPVSVWAATQDFGFAADETGHGVSREGEILGKPWRLEMGSPSRDYIHGEEIRARAELGIIEDVAVLVINRSLKDKLEERAYEMYTDSLQTSGDPHLPEEMRWLAIYNEVGWDSLPPQFSARYAVLTDEREYAMAWLDADLAKLMADWPEPALTADVPFVFLLLRGKAYLRMECAPPDMHTVQHASRIFTSACEAALGSFPPQPPPVTSNVSRHG
jgi:hypothetical protein